MNRRDFLALGSALATMAVPLTLFGSRRPKGLPLDLAGRLYFTREQPGRWEAKVKGHLPHFSAKREDDRWFVTLSTEHEMVPQHYIVKHQLFDENYTLLSEHLFIPGTASSALSEHVIATLPKSGYMVSVCNKHDMWVEPWNLGLAGSG